jgi:hypothetical protein
MTKKNERRYFECFECNCKFDDLATEIEREVEHVFADEFIVRYYVECPECGDRYVIEAYDVDWDGLTLEEKERYCEYDPALPENWGEDEQIAYDIANRPYGIRGWW